MNLPVCAKCVTHNFADLVCSKCDGPILSFERRVFVEFEGREILVHSECKDKEVKLRDNRAMPNWSDL